MRNYDFLFGKVTGDFVVIEDADDWSNETRLAKQVAGLEDEELVLCATGSIFHFPTGKISRLGLERSRVIDGAFDEFPSHLASTMFRRSMLQLFPDWHEYFAGGTSMDRYFLMDLLDARKDFTAANRFYHATVRSASSHCTLSERKMVTHQLFLELQRQREARGTDAFREGDFATLARLKAAFGRKPKLISESLRESAVINVDCGEVRTAGKLLAIALWLDPFSTTNWRTAICLMRRILHEQSAVRSRMRPKSGNRKMN